MKTSPKVLFLGFCAGDRDLILQWAKSGDLPNIQALLEKGRSGKTLSIPGFYVGSTWISFSTGVTPAKHGIHSWEQLRVGTYDSFRCLTGENLQWEPFWDHLSRAGQRVAVLDIPLSSLSKALNGIQMVEWGAHDAQYGFLTYPASLAWKVKARFGTHPRRGNCDATRDPKDYLALHNDLIHGIRSKVQLTKYYLKQERWDFFAQVFTESHCIGHQCWHLHDPGHPWHDPEAVELIGDPIKNIYQAIDQGMGEILREIDEETTVIFLAGHGMGPKYQAQFLLDQILLGLGLAEPALYPEESALTSSWTFRQLVDAGLTKVWQHLPAGIQVRIQPIRKTLRRWFDGARPSPKPTIDRAASQCFVINNNFAHGGIRINLVGREPKGIVNPGDEFHALGRYLEKELLEIVNLDTGRRVVNRVLKTAEWFSGEHLDRLPDLLVEWSNDAPVYRIGSPTLGEIRGEYSYCRTGEHKPGGLCIAIGPTITQGKFDRTISILDFASTISTLLGVPLQNTDGKPIEDLVASLKPTHSDTNSSSVFNQVGPESHQQ